MILLRAQGTQRNTRHRLQAHAGANPPRAELQLLRLVGQLEPRMKHQPINTVKIAGFTYRLQEGTLDLQ